MVISSIDLRAMAALVQSMTTAAKTLEDSARSMKHTSEHVFGSASETQKIIATAGWVKDQLPGLRRRLALAQQIDAQARRFQPTVQIDETHLSSVPPDVAIAQGAAAAKKVKESGADLDPALIAQIAQNQNDPYFSAGFAQNVAPAELARLVLDISRKREGVSRNDSAIAVTQIKEWEQQYIALITTIGTTIGTATRNTGELALPAGYATQWVTTITADPKGNTEVPVAPGQGAAASLVLRCGNYSTSFLNTVSAKVYDYERRLGEHADREWAHRSTLGVTASFGGPYLPDGSPQPDPLANILEALSHNPQAAQNFFDVANPHAAQAPDLKISRRSVNDRLKYLLQDRQWPTGSELGHALEAATTEWRDGDVHGRTSADIAAQTFALIGERTGRSDGWEMPTGLRPGVAKMLASYMPDIYRMRAVNNPKADPDGGSWMIDTDQLGFPPGQPFGIKLDPKLMDQVIATLGENESDIQIVTAGVIATQQIRQAYALAKSLADNPNAPVMVMTGDKVPFLTNASLESAGVLGWVVNTAYQGDKADEELQKKKAELMAKTISIVTGVPILQLKTAAGTLGEWEKFAFNQAKDRAITEIGKAPKGSSSGVYGEMDQQSKVALRDSTFKLMLQAGYLKPEYFAAANKAEGGATYQGPPPTAFHGHANADGTWVVDQPPQFDLASSGYTDWARYYGDNEWILGNVYNPYDDQFPNIR